MPRRAMLDRGPGPTYGTRSRFWRLRRSGRMWAWLRIGLLCVLYPALASALASGTRTYRVRPGDSLIRIARHHGTTVAALCAANDLERSQIIRVGQKLVLPASSDRPKRPASASLSKRDSASAQSAASAPKREPEPVRSKAEASRAQAKRARSLPSTAKTPSWAPYSKPPARRGYLDLESTVGRWSGQAVIGHWEVPEAARLGISRVFASWRTGGEERIHGRLIRLLARVSDQFGGRKIRIVSGYRERSPHQYARNSKHNLGRAVDFSIPGVPNEVLRDYLLHTFENVGVGYYPNSTHVHLDIREKPAYWVDYSRPGQPPRYVPDRAPAVANKARTSRPKASSPPPAEAPDSSSPSQNASAGHDASPSAPVASDSTNPKQDQADAPDAVEPLPERNAVATEPTGAGG